jgi:hypothetical protein
MALEVPTMLVAGDADAVRMTRLVELFPLFGGGQREAGLDGSGISSARRAVLPGTTHHDLFRSPALSAALLPFLATPPPAPR